jgi:hypothetical protein
LVVDPVILEIILLPIFVAAPLGTQALGTTTLLARFQPLGRRLVVGLDAIVPVDEVLLKILETMAYFS